MAWFKRFTTAILLPNGRRLLTLQDASDYIAALPKAESDAADWQLAMEALYASGDGPWLCHLERMADRAYAA